MTIQQLQEAKQESERFLNRIKELESRVKKDGWLKWESGYISGCSESGAVRRSSMDLTRTLAKLRK